MLKMESVVDCPSQKEKKTPTPLPLSISVYHCGRKKGGRRIGKQQGTRVSWIHPHLFRLHKWKTSHLSLLSLSHPHSSSIPSNSPPSPTYPGPAVVEPSGSWLLVDFCNQACSWSQLKFPAAVGSSAILIVLLFITS